MVKFFVFIMMGWFSVAIQARDDLLVAVSTPRPEYPRKLLEKRHTGKVLASLTISAFGTVQRSKIIESSHPQLAEATQHAMVKWRYQPWAVADGKPGNVEVTILVIFGARGIKPFSGEVTVGLQNTLCAYLNHEMHLSERNFPLAPLSTVDVFWHTRQYLSSDYVQYRLPRQEDREALFAELEKAIPTIIKNCRRNPDARYAEYLPQAIRSLLASHQ